MSQQVIVDKRRTVVTHWPGTTEKQPSKCDYYAQQIGRPEQEQIEVVVRINVVRDKPAAQHQQTQDTAE